MIFNSVTSSLFKRGISATIRLEKFRKMHLLLNKSLVNGSWVSAASGKELSVRNPVNGNVIGNVPDMNVDDTKVAIQAAHTAFKSTQWTSLTAKDRSNLLNVSKLRKKKR